MKQWELPNNSKVKLPDGSFATYLKMDGMYAKWDKDGEFLTGNYENLEKEEDYYKVITNTENKK